MCLQQKFQTLIRNVDCIFRNSSYNIFCCFWTRIHKMLPIYEVFPIILHPCKNLYVKNLLNCNKHKLHFFFSFKIFVLFAFTNFKLMPFLVFFRNFSVKIVFCTHVSKMISCLVRVHLIMFCSILCFQIGVLPLFFFLM